MEITQKIAVLFMFLLGSFVCFASLYRIITIVHLTQTTDISYAKSDVFIWSSVEPSIGIISGCLPTLRPLLMHILEAVFGYVPASAHASSEGSSPLETISKKRTRKINKRDVLDETQFTQLGDDADTDGSAGKDRSRFQSGNRRPAEDEMGLTTVVQGKDSQVSVGMRTDQESLESTRNGSGITVSKEFAWGENTHAR